MKICVSEICVKRIRVNQGVGVYYDKLQLQLQLPICIRLGLSYIASTACPCILSHLQRKKRSQNKKYYSTCVRNKYCHTCKGNIGLKTKSIIQLAYEISTSINSHDPNRCFRNNSTTVLTHCDWIEEEAGST